MRHFTRPKAVLDENLSLGFWLHSAEISDQLIVRVYLNRSLIESAPPIGPSPFHRGKPLSNGWQPFSMRLGLRQALTASQDSERLNVVVLGTGMPFAIADLDVDRQIAAVIAPAYVRELVRAAPEYDWQVEQRYHVDGKVYFVGWAAQPYVTPQLLVNSQEAIVQSGKFSRTAEQHYWFMRDAPWFGFEATAPQPADEGWLRIERIGSFRTFAGTEMPLFSQYRHFGSLDHLAAPPVANVNRVSGKNSSIVSYHNSGKTDFHTVEAIAAHYGVNLLKDIDLRILDWGCGCARVTRHLAELPGAERRVVGVDIDSENVAWCQENVRGPTFEPVGLLPPTRFTDDSFDLIIALSVLSHLTETAMDRWLEEVSRLLGSGGLAMLTYNGNGSAARYLSRHPEKHLAAMRDGFYAGIRDSNLDAQISDQTYYRLTFMSDVYAVKKFSQFFDVLDIVPSSLCGFQNTAILAKKGVGSKPLLDLGGLGND